MFLSNRRSRWDPPTHMHTHTLPQSPLLACQVSFHKYPCSSKDIFDLPANLLFPTSNDPPYTAAIPHPLTWTFHVDSICEVFLTPSINFQQSLSSSAPQKWGGMVLPEEPMPNSSQSCSRLPGHSLPTSEMVWPNYHRNHCEWVGHWQMETLSRLPRISTCHMKSPTFLVSFTWLWDCLALFGWAWLMSSMINCLAFGRKSNSSPQILVYLCIAGGAC